MKNHITTFTALATLLLCLSSCARNQQMGCPYGMQESKKLETLSNDYNKIVKESTEYVEEKYGIVAE